MYSPEQYAIAKVLCDEDLLFYTSFVFKVIRGRKFLINNHHRIICDYLQMVERYIIEILNINMPPRFTKTELAAINFISRAIGLNPYANFLYITASDELRALVSTEIRNIINSRVYKDFYGIEIKADQNSKNLWCTKQGGGVKTATIFGQITGFGAGQMVDSDLEDYIKDFGGCIILDDINKTDDSEMNTANNEKVNRILGNTILSRRNSKDTAIINIHHRTGLNDATAYLENHFAGNEKMYTLVMPVVNDKNELLWEFKVDHEEINRLKNNPRTRNMFLAQYMQDPRQDLEALFFLPSEMQNDQVQCIYYDIIDEFPDIEKENEKIAELNKGRKKDFIEKIKPIPYGADLGFNPDPSTLYKMAIQGNIIYVDELLYERNLINIDPSSRENEQTLQYQFKKNGVGSNIVIMDIDHVTIRELRLCGLTVMPAIKGPNSIENGLRRMTQYIFKITRRSMNLLFELKGYRKFRDPITGQFMFKPDPQIRMKHGIDSMRYVIFAKDTYW